MEKFLAAASKHAVAIAVIVFCATTGATDSEYAANIASALNTSWFKWVKDEPRGTLPREYTNRWNELKLVANVNDGPGGCVSSYSPARTYVDGSGGYVTEICVRFFRYMVDLADAVTRFSFLRLEGQREKEAVDLLEEYGNYLGRQIADDMARAMDGQPQQRSCTVDMFVYLRTKGLSRDNCAAQAKRVATDFERWRASEQNLPRSFIKQYKALQADKTPKLGSAMQEYDEYIRLVQISTLMYMVLHEFGHQINGDFGTNSLCDTNSLACEQKADAFALDILSKIPNNRVPVYISTSAIANIYMGLAHGKIGTVPFETRARLSVNYHNRVMDNVFKDPEYMKMLRAKLGRPMVDALTKRQ